MSDGSFFSELRKRKVLQAAAIYGAVAWGVTEVVVTVVEQLFLPQWVATLAVIGFVVGFPVAMFPVLFAIPRTVGWLTQWEEMLEDGDQRIARPRQIYEGEDIRSPGPLEGTSKPEGATAGVH